MTAPSKAPASFKAGRAPAQFRWARLNLCAALAPCLLLSGTALAQGSAATAFRDDFNTFSPARWYISDGWSNGDHQNCVWSKDQLRLGGGLLQLVFQKRPIKDRAYACAEVRTNAKLGYGTYEARFKTDVGSGMNAAFFTYTGPNPHDEIDFEVLMKDTTKTDVNTYVGGKPFNGTSVTLPNGRASAGFNTYAFVWEPNRLRWFVNGVQVHQTAPKAKMPTHRQQLFFSLWGSDTFTDWMGPFKDPGRPLTMEIDWVAFTPLGGACQFQGSKACDVAKERAPRRR